MKTVLLGMWRKVYRRRVHTINSPTDGVGRVEGSFPVDVLKPDIQDKHDNEDEGENAARPDR